MQEFYIQPFVIIMVFYLDYNVLKKTNKKNLAESSKCRDGEPESSESLNQHWPAKAQKPSTWAVVVLAHRPTSSIRNSRVTLSTSPVFFLPLQCEAFFLRPQPFRVFSLLRLRTSPSPPHFTPRSSSSPSRPLRGSPTVHNQRRDATGAGISSPAAHDLASSSSNRRIHGLRQARD